MCDKICSIASFQRHDKIHHYPCPTDCLVGETKVETITLKIAELDNGGLYGLLGAYSRRKIQLLREGKQAIREGL